MLGTLLFLLPMVIKIFKEIQDDVDDQEDPDSSNVDVDVDVDDQEAPDSSKVYEQAVSERRKEGRDAEDDRLEEERGEDEGGREEEAGTHSAYLKKGSLLTFTWSKKLEIGN